MGNAAEQRVFRQKPDVYQLDTRIAVLETKFDHIDEELKELNQSIKEIGTTVNASVIAASARHKLWLFIFSLLGVSTVILKFIGINI